MADGKFELEPGQYQWDNGQYQGIRQLPPGWFAAPHEEGRIPSDSPPPPPRTPMPPPREAEPQPEEPVPVSPAPVAAIRAPVTLPTERVDLIAKRARFLGHDIDVSDDGVESIRMILAMEIDAALERERARIYAAVHQSDLQAPAGAGGKDVPEVQGSEGSVDKAAQSGERAMQ